jgi:outer membrane protein assembly factor BamB
VIARDRSFRWSLALLLASAPAAQNVPPRAPPPIPTPRPLPDGVEGPAVRMVQSADLDRYLRKAQEALERGDVEAAIEVLQSVVEGRVHPTAAGAAPNPDEPPPPRRDDPAEAVFSLDDRLFRPVVRLCHRFLADLPESGQALYRQTYEVAAERALDEALAQRDPAALARVSRRWFVTLSSGRALYAAADLLMHAGRFRAALQTLRTLQDEYPARLLAALPEVSPEYLCLKMALCCSLVGDGRSASEIMERLAADAATPLRVRGELVSLGELARSPLFDRAAPPPALADSPAVLRSLGDLVPVWQYGYAEPDPYQSPAPSNSAHFLVQGSETPASPWYNKNKPGTSVCFDGERLVFMDHYRLHVHDLGRGLVRMQTSEPDRPPKAVQGRARSRIPVYDFVGMRVAIDAERYYCIVGSQVANAVAAELSPVLSNQLVAYDRETLAPVWTTSPTDAARGYRGVTFLATPTVLDGHLLVPVLVDGTYALQAVDAATGASLYRVPLHAGGTELARAPAVPVVVQSGTAYVLTNAGALAAVDAASGELQWIRRYERSHPMRSGVATRQRTSSGGAMARQFFRYVTLPGFVPTDLVAAEGRVILAPSDGEVMICLDGASGEPLWMVSKPAGNEVGGSDVYVVGHNSRHVYVCGARLTCIDIRSGLRLWDVEVPEKGWSGRGLVTEDLAVLPGSQCIHSIAADGRGGWHRTPLPAFSVGRKPLFGPANLFARGPYLVACHESGVEVFASLQALHELCLGSADPEQQAELLVQAGDLAAAIEVLTPLCRDTTRSEAEHKKIARRTLMLVRGVVLARHGMPREDALRVLDRAREWIRTRDLLLQWQLVRIELMQSFGDAAAAEREQEILYEMMEGKRR